MNLRNRFGIRSVFPHVIRADVTPSCRTDGRLAEAAENCRMGNPGSSSVWKKRWKSRATITWKEDVVRGIATVAALLFCGGLFGSAESAPGRSDGYIYQHSGFRVSYGKPDELRAIRRRLTFLCTGGRNLPGLGPAVADELIQVGDYAIAEGSCGNPELHLVLNKVNGSWQEREGQGCGLGGGVVPDYGTFGAYDKLVTHCRFPVSVAKNIIAIRSGIPYIAAADKQVRAFEKKCSANPQSDTSCPGHRFTPQQQRSVDYNRFFQETSEAVYNGDFARALSYARRALKIEPAGFHDQEARVAELERLVPAPSSRAMTTEQAIAEWKRLGL